MPPLAQPRSTPNEYLARERKAKHKSEYLYGRIYAMAGASRPHNLIVLNLAAELRAQLRGEPRFEDAHVDTLLNPTAIVEVLSESTERYDRGEKFAHYRRLEFLTEYVLIAQDKLRVELYVRQGEHWVLTEISDGSGMLSLASLGCTLALRDIYERVEFPGAEESTPDHPNPI